MNTLNTNTNDMLVVTIVIQMHGTVITYDLNSKTANIFDNTRLLCKAGGLQEYISGQSGLPGILEEFMLVKNLREIFGQDLDRSTYDIIKNAKSGLLIGNITFDKSLSTKSGDLYDYFFKYFQGIYLLSIHRGRELMYPTNPNEKVINLLKVDDLQRLADFLKTNVPDLQEDTTPFPNQEIYIEEENMVNKDSILSKDVKTQKIEKIREQFMKLIYNWDLTLDSNGNIEDIKLSYLVKLIKKIIGEQIIINLLDYSCNAPTSYISKKQTPQYAIQEYDEESGISINPKYGGKKKTRRQRRKKRQPKKLSNFNITKKQKRRTRKYIKK
jgi:hypothetical protein